jgi:hypothetical protein
MSVINFTSLPLDSDNDTTDTITAFNPPQQDKTPVQLKVSGSIAGVIQGQMIANATDWADLATFSQADANAASIIFKEVTTFPFYRLVHTSGAGSVTSASIYIR